MITSIEKLKAVAGVREIELPGWDDGEPFVCRVKRPTMLSMAAGGGIPNPLISVAEELMSGRNPQGKASYQEIAGALTRIARLALVEPTAQELDEAGVTLTDQQVNQLYAYVLGGTAALDRFRQAVWGGAGQHGDDVQLPPE